MTDDTLTFVFVGLLGLTVGSFLNVCIHRLPAHASIVSPGSRCPSCGYALRWFDNIPVLSYLMLGGRCRSCRAPISIRYPVVELLTMGLFLLHLHLLGVAWLLLPRLLFACALVVLFAIDLEHQLLPDAITLPGIAIGGAFSFVAAPGPTASALGTLLGAASLWIIAEGYRRYAGQEGMGRGDIKMLAMIGAFLGWQAVLVTLMLSSVAGAGVGLAIVALRRGDMKYALPYGTFLAAAALVTSLYGDSIVTWYTGLYGR